LGQYKLIGVSLVAATVCGTTIYKKSPE